MANVDAAYGLKPVRHQTGGKIQTNAYTIASGYATAIYKGDPVLVVTGGTIERNAAGNVRSQGVFAGVEYTDSQGVRHFSKYWPASTVATDIVAHVYDDPMLIFAIQSDATGVALTELGACADWEIVAGSAATGISKTNLDASAAIGSTTAGLRVLRLVPADDNAFGAYADVEVMFAEHALITTGAAI